MSMPFSVLACPSCGYEGTSMCLWGQFSYLDDRGTEAHTERRLGWCHDCHRFEAVKALPDAGSVTAMQVAAIEETEELEPVSGLRWLRNLQSGTARENRRKARGALNRAELVATVMAPNRAPRCLECGSARIEGIALPDPETLTPTYDLELTFRTGVAPFRWTVRGLG